jgi:4-amino-4-deoxy-L-arabinose transferase-like glycosyltransferase
MSLFSSLRPSPPKNRPVYWVFLFILIGFGLRLQNLSFQPLWGDEGWSFYFAVQPLPELLALTAIDIHPPLYYILLKGWLFITGIGPEEARFFSVITGTMLIPTLYVLGQRLFDDRVGVTGAAVVSVMPMAIYYSQEVRMYGLVTLLGAMAVYFFVRQGSRWLTAYVVTMTAALYTMYYAALIFLFQILYILLTRFWFRERKGRFASKFVYSTLAPFIYVALIYLPWLIYAGPRLVNYVENKRDVEGYLPLNFIRFLGDHLVAFSVGHLSPNLQQYIWVALLFVVIASLGFMAALSFNKHKPHLYLPLYLFTPLLMGYLINLVYPFTPRFFERTLLLAAPAYWLLIAAGIIWLWDRQYLLVGTVVLAMLLVINVSLIGFYTMARYPNEDYRPLLKDIATRATPEDTLLASYQWQLGFYHAYLPPPRPRFFPVPDWGEGWADRQPQLVQDLTNIFETSPRLWFPAHQALGHLWEDEAEAAIASLGYPTLLKWYNPQTKLTLTGTPFTSFAEGPTANFANRLTLLTTKVGNGKYEAGRGIVPVELTWQKEKSLGSNHLVSLRLTDAEGRTWATRDSHPQAGQVYFTDLATGDILTDRHGLLIPAGTPPGLYRLLLSVRRTSDAHPLDLLDTERQPLGAELLLTQVEVIDPNPNVDPAALPVQFATAAIFGREVQLVGFSLGHGPFKAGETLPLTLFWHSLADQPGPLTVSIQLQDAAGQIIFSQQKEPIRPTSDWQRGTLVRDPQDLPLPPALPPGEYRLVVGLSTLAQAPLKVAGNDQLPLAMVTTIDRPHVFEPPTPQIELTVNFSDQARLVGLDLPETQVKAGEQFSLTLYWQAITTFDRSWKVFVHLLDAEDQIISQQDQIPGAGQFPTTGWLPGEYLTDAYILFIPADAPPGQYWLEIGLYDVNDSPRLPVVEGGEIIGDHIFLENWPISVE